MERILLTAKLKLAPTPEQKEWLWEMSRAATRLYNLALEQRCWHWLRYHHIRPGITYAQQNAQLVELKEAFPEFKVLYSLVAQEVLRQIEKNFNSFFGRLKSQRANDQQQTARPPRFKSSRYFFTLCYVQSGFAVENGRLVLSGGQGRRERIAIAGARHIPAEIHSLTITYDRKSDAFYANVTYWAEVKLEQGERPLRVVAFDPGRKVFLTGADDSGLLVEIHSRTNSINAYFNKQIDRVKSLRDRCKKGSRRWKHLNKRDRYMKSADERYTTQRCSRCGHRQKLEPSVRVYRCPKCGLVMGRDENSAVNMLNKVLAELARPPVKPEGFTKTPPECPRFLIGG